MKTKYWLLLLYCWSIAPLGWAQSADISFLHVRKGLSSNFVRAILQDYQGYLWVGTENGLHRYDGSRFKVFDIDPNDVRATPSGRIHSLMEDHKRQLWITSFGGGIFRYDRATERFLRQTELEAPSHLNTNNVFFLLETHDHNIWIASTNGIGVWNPQTGDFRKITADANKPNRLSYPAVTHLMQDKEGYIWATTYSGLNRIHPQTLQVERFDWAAGLLRDGTLNAMHRVLQDKQGRVWVASLSGGVNYLTKQPNGQWQWHELAQSNSSLKELLYGPVLTLLEDHSGRIWIGTENKGLACYNPDTDQLQLYANNPNDQQSLSNNSIWTIFQDKANRIWLGTHAQGLELIDEFNRKFKHINQRPYSDGLNHKTISSFLEIDGNVWIGTDGGGINIWNRKTNSFEYLTQANGLTSNAILCMQNDKKGYVWVGSWSGGLMRIDPKTKHVTQLAARAVDAPGRLLHVFDMQQDSKSNLWLATFESGLVLYDISQGTFTRYLHSNDNLTTLCIDQKDTVWAGTENGIAKVWRQDGKVIEKLFAYDSIAPYPVRHRAADAVFADSANRIWMGFSEGLAVYDAGKFFFFNKKNGLPTNFVNGIWADQQQHFWLSTDKGLVRLKYSSPGKISQAEVYNEGDGLQGDLFFRHTFYQGADKTIYVGGGNGFNYFQLQDLTTNPDIPQIQFSNFKIFNESVNYTVANSPLSQHINETELVVLNHEQNIFSIEFVALAFTKPERNQYAYRLEGLEKNWNYVGNQQMATYTNLDAGDYTFHVKAANNDGLWTPSSRSIRIRILPPFWRTYWFYALVGGTVLILLYIWYKWRVRSIEEQKKQLEAEVALRTHELREANEELSQHREELIQQTEEVTQINETLNKRNVLIENKNEIITSSINYASTIQRAILPRQTEVGRQFEHFIIFKPKDIVSGDFYWYTCENEGLPNEKTFIAAVDCTGHGVPGAFMSMIGSTLLNAIIRIEKNYDPSDILEKLDQRIRRALRQDQTENPDGMDVCLCCIEKTGLDTRLVYFAGARRPLFVSRPGFPVVRISGNRRGLGGRYKQSTAFEKESISLNRGDLIYLTSDGYIDQSNPERQRFGTTAFIELLQQIQASELPEQKLRLENALQQFQLHELQRDDMVVIGLRL